MNGNFEHDKGAYPYTSTRVGDHHYVVHTPTQVRVVAVAVPRNVGERIALFLNQDYYGHRVRKAFDMTLPDDHKAVKTLALTGLRYEYDEGDEGLSGAQYQQLKDALS